MFKIVGLPIIQSYLITLIDQLNWSQGVGVAFKIPFDAVIHDTALTGVLTGCRTSPEDLLPSVSIIPVTKLSQVVLERNRK